MDGVVLCVRRSSLSCIFHFCFQTYTICIYGRAVDKCGERIRTKSHSRQRGIISGSIRCNVRGHPKGSSLTVFCMRMLSSLSMHEWFACVLPPTTEEHTGNKLLSLPTAMTLLLRDKCVETVRSDYE